MTPEEKIRNDEQYYYDTRTRDRDVRRSRSYFNWIPLLLIPLFFVMGWVSNGVYNRPQNGVTTPQYGVGGGPGEVTPYPQGYVATPTPGAKTQTDATASPTVDTNADEEVMDSTTPSPSPSTTPTHKATPKGSASPEV